MPVAGLPYSASSNGMAFFVTAFRNGLKQTGHIESQNVAVECRWGEGQTDGLPALAADLIGRQVAVLQRIPVPRWCSKPANTAISGCGRESIRPKAGHSMM
jgi:putative tryptophan/tyrosine transport system substrate-binding protein